MKVLKIVGPGLPGHADRDSHPMAVHLPGGPVFRDLQFAGRTVPADCGTVDRLRNIDLDGSPEARPGRVHRLYDPGYRTRDHRCYCSDSGRIIRFYLVMTRKTEYELYRSIQNT